MATDKPGRGVDDDPYARCLAYIEDDQIALAERQARRIEAFAIRSIAEDQIRFVLDITACIASGNEDEAKSLTELLIGGIKLKYETALGIRPGHHPRPPPSPRPGKTKTYAGRAGRRPQPALTDAPPGVQGIVKQLTQVIGRARTGDQQPDFSPAVLLELGRLAHRAWRRPGFGRGFSPIRANASEILIVGVCLRQRIEGSGGRLSREDLCQTMGLSPARVEAAARNLRKFLLHGSGWRMVGDAKAGFALESEDPDM